MRAYLCSHFEPVAISTNVGGPSPELLISEVLVPFWVLSVIRHLVFRGPKGTIILTTSHTEIGSICLFSLAWPLGGHCNAEEWKRLASEGQSLCGCFHKLGVPFWESL